MTFPSAAPAPEPAAAVSEPEQPDQSALLAQAIEALQAAKSEMAQLKADADTRIAELEAKVDASAEAAALEVREEVVHWLHLADGSAVEQVGAIPTHVDTGNGVVPVTAAYRKVS
jgi:hypothetical protein